VASREEGLGARIRAARLAAGLTQPDLAALIGLKHPQSISNYERDVSHPDAGRMRLIAEATGKPFSYFFPDDASSDELTGIREEVVELRGEIAGLAKDFQDLRELLLARAREQRGAS
jgi:transcriptional regulator with XRE-family HTH domain